MDDKTILFSVIAGHNIGTGHILRCLNISRHLIGKTKIFFSLENGKDFLSFVKDHRIEILEPKEAFIKFYPSLVVVDRLDVEASFLLPFKEKKIKIILLDSLSNWEMADIVINALPYPSYNKPFLPKGVKVFEGPSYICLDDEVYANKGPCMIREVASKILVTCGGSDPYGLTIKLAKALVQLPNSLHITFVLGQLFKEREGLEGIVRGKNCSIIQDAKSLAPYMMEADLALTSFGLTVYEAACLGLPTIILSPTTEHNLRAEIFAKFGSAINLGLNEDVSLSKIIYQVEELRYNFGLRQRMAQAGRNLVDGLGARRVAQIILDLLFS